MIPFFSFLLYPLFLSLPLTSHCIYCNTLLYLLPFPHSSRFLYIDTRPISLFDVPFSPFFLTKLQFLSQQQQQPLYPQTSTSKNEVRSRSPFDHLLHRHGFGPYGHAVPCTPWWRRHQAVQRPYPRKATPPSFLPSFLLPSSTNHRRHPLSLFSAFPFQCLFCLPLIQSMVLLAY